MENENLSEILQNEVKYLPTIEEENGKFYIVEKILDKRSNKKKI